jgi:purine-binding chemotaxis protein CheW
MGDLVQAAAPAPSSAVAARPLAAAGDANQYLTFLLGGEMFAVGILNVKEIIEYGSLTEIPMMPAFIRGVINLRGAVVPVIDLSARFGGKTTEVARRTCIVIVEVQQEEGRHDIGIMVDAVSEVLEIAAGDIEPPPAFGAKIRADFIAGMGKVNAKFVIILDILRVLSVEEMVAVVASVAARNETAGAGI